MRTGPHVRVATHHAVTLLPYKLSVTRFQRKKNIKMCQTPHVPVLFWKEHLITPGDWSCQCQQCGYGNVLTIYIYKSTHPFPGFWQPVQQDGRLLGAN
jgi:hypothetical protein